MTHLRGAGYRAHPKSAGYRNAVSELVRKVEMLQENLDRVENHLRQVTRERDGLLEELRNVNASRDSWAKMCQEAWQSRNLTLDHVRALETELAELEKKHVDTDCA